MEKEKKEARVNWSISGTVECPECEHDNDFMDQDEWYFFCQPGENTDKENAPFEMYCEKCHKLIKVTGSDY